MSITYPRFHLSFLWISLWQRRQQATMFSWDNNKSGRSRTFNLWWTKTAGYSLHISHIGCLLMYHFLALSHLLL